MEKTCRTDIAWVSFLLSVRLSNFLSVHSMLICINRLATYTHTQGEKKDIEHEREKYVIMYFEDHDQLTYCKVKDEK